MTENKNFTLDQKLKAFEIAVNIVHNIGGKPEFPRTEPLDQPVFNAELDHYLESCGNLAKNILLKLDPV